jgi:hypothetical protein
MIHGGFWRVRYDLLHAVPVRGSRRCGFATANIEYRRVGEPGGGWPGTFDDETAVTFSPASMPAIRWRPRAIVVGHSAETSRLWVAAKSRSLFAAIGLAPVASLHQTLSDHAAAELTGAPRRISDRHTYADPARPTPVPRIDPWHRRRHRPHRIEVAIMPRQPD